MNNNGVYNSSLAVEELYTYLLRETIYKQQKTGGGAVR